MHTALPYSAPCSLSSKRDCSHASYNDYLSEDEYLGLQQHLAGSPESGDVVPGSGGVRKLRWAVKGRGKRGGVRVVYVARVAKDIIWLLTIYAKNEVESIPANVLRKIREELEND